MRLALTMIARSDDAEHKDLALSLDSAKKVGFTDFVIGVDDRSHPNTSDWIFNHLRDLGVLGNDYSGAHSTEGGITIFPFEMEADGDPHFANARNLTLPRVPKECEWWGWMDSDDVIESISGKTIPEFLETLTPQVRAVAFNYHYADDEFGNPKGHLKVRLFNVKQPWRWRDRVHEDCEPADGKRIGKDIVVIKDEDESEFRWVHHAENKVIQPGRNFRCLRRMLQDDPDYPRVWFYLGNQHFAAHNFRLAAEAYERYVPLSGWDEERWWALVYAAISYRSIGELDKAIERDLQAVKLLPNLVDAYFGLGESYCRKNDWQQSIKWGELGIERLVAQDKGSRQPAIPSNLVWFNANAYAFQPYTWLAVSYNNIGDPEKALECYKQAYKARPEEEIGTNIKLIEAALNRRRVTHNGIDLAAGLAKNGEPLKAINILEALPAGSKDDPNVVRMGQHIAQQLAHLRDRTAYQNFYFATEETNDPLGPATTDEMLEVNVPRMLWALRRLQSVGAKKVLDVGVGDGTFAFLLARHGIQVVGIDVDWRRVQRANKFAAQAGYQAMRSLDVDPLLEFSDDCACEHEHSDHGYHGCKAEDCVCEAKWLETQAGQILLIPEATPESMAQFLYCPPDQITPQVKALGPYDACVGMELLEHVQDPDDTLGVLESMASRVLLSVPDGGWNGPVSWNVGHVRAYSQRDLGRLIVTHGWPTELHLISRDSTEQGQVVAEYTKSPPQSDARVVIFCPPTAHDWTPDSLRTGLGGSETAVVQLAREFSQMGKRVTVYAMCEGLWDGVRYRYSVDFRPESCEVFIAWRNPDVLADMRGLAGHRFIWTHDVHFGPASPELLDGVTVIALSDWHRRFLHDRYPTADIAVLGNGIDPARFDADVPRIPHRLIYAHSPDRGLAVVLGLFPQIRAKYPDATLSVFYGFDAARHWYPEFMSGLEERLAATPGVTVNGWVGQQRLAEEYQKADVLLYPAVIPTGELFPETYCISVVEAQAAGCFPITANHGALAETNARGTQLSAGEFATRALDVLEAFWAKPPHKQQRRRVACQAWAKRQTWTSVAQRWLALVEPEIAVEAAQ